MKLAVQIDKIAKIHRASRNNSEVTFSDFVFKVKGNVGPLKDNDTVFLSVISHPLRFAILGCGKAPEASDRFRVG